MARYGGEFIPMAILYDHKGISLQSYTSKLNKVYKKIDKKELNKEEVWETIFHESFFDIYSNANKHSLNESRGTFNKRIFWHFMNNCEPEIGWTQENNLLYLDTNSILNLKGIYRYKRNNAQERENVLGEPVRDYVWNSIILTSEVIRSSSWERFKRNIPTEYLDVDTAEFLIENPESLRRIRSALITLYDCTFARNTKLSWSDLIKERLLRTQNSTKLEGKILEEEYKEAIKEYREFQRKREEKKESNNLRSFTF
jgi:hypothetical protein